jgi:RimJ/RimL family protein N-acetyltransferase
VNDVAPLGAYPKTVVLTDGTHLELRLALPGDAAAIAALSRHGPPHLSLPPGGDPAATTERRALTVVASDTARVVAEATLVRGRDGDGRVALLAVRIAPTHQGRRLGTWMLLDCVHLAAALDVEVLAAPVRRGDTAYLAALRRLDFVDDATLREEYDVPDGAGQDLVVLVKAVHRQWTDF